jgi:cytoskeletal protein CcmA (bactofilin family)
VSLFGKNRDDRDGRDPWKKTATPVPGPWDESAKPTKPTEAAAEPPPELRATPQPTTPTRASAGGDMANIGKSITIKGDLSGNEDLVVEGNVEGRIELPNNQLTIGSNGNVKADLSAKSVVVIGKVAGNVTGVERVQIEGTGSVQGDVRTPRLVVQEGAILNGSVEMGPTKVAAAHTPTLARAVAGGSD